MSNKRVCVLNRETQMIMRVSREFADAAVRGSSYDYTTKSALHKFLKRDVRLKKNERVFDRALDHKSYRGKRKNLALVLLEKRPSIIAWFRTKTGIKGEPDIITTARKRFRGSKYQQMFITD